MPSVVANEINSSKAPSGGVAAKMALIIMSFSSLIRSTYIQDVPVSLVSIDPSHSYRYFACVVPTLFHVYLDASLQVEPC